MASLEAKMEEVLTLLHASAASDPKLSADNFRDEAAVTLLRWCTMVLARCSCT